MTRIAFATCVTLGQSCLDTLVSRGVKIDLAITLPDNRATMKSGRVYLDRYCESHSIPLIKSKNINDANIVAAVESHRIDILFVIGWSQIVRSELLAVPTIGVFGIHPTLLPTGRGRAAIPWAIIKNLDRTGVTLFKIDEGVDTGPIIDQQELPLTRTTTATDLYDQVNAAHITLIERNIPAFLARDIEMHPQDETDATEWPGRTPQDGDLQLCHSAVEAERLVRATTRPYPGAFFEKDGKRITVWACTLCTIGHSDVPSLAFDDGVMIATDYEFTMTQGST